MRCNEIQWAQGVENAEATSLASGRTADGSDTRYFFADVSIIVPEHLLLILYSIGSAVCFFDILYMQEFRYISREVVR